MAAAAVAAVVLSILIAPTSNLLLGSTVIEAMIGKALSCEVFGPYGMLPINHASEVKGSFSRVRFYRR